MSHMTHTIHCLESQEKGRLLSQIEVNSKNVSAMTLQSGKEIERSKTIVSKDKSENQIKNELKKEEINKATLVVTLDSSIKINTNPNLSLIGWRCQNDKSKKKKFWRCSGRWQSISLYCNNQTSIKMY